MHLLEQLAQREESPDLGLVQPEPGEGVAGRGGGRLHESVAALRPIPRDRCVQAVAEILEIALEGGARDLELFEKRLDGDEPALAEQRIDPVEALGPVHTRPSSSRSRHPPIATGSPTWYRGTVRRSEPPAPVWFEGAFTPGRTFPGNAPRERAAARGASGTVDPQVEPEPSHRFRARHVDSRPEPP